MGVEWMRVARVSHPDLPPYPALVEEPQMCGASHPRNRPAPQNARMWHFRLQGPPPQACIGGHTGSISSSKFSPLFFLLSLPVFFLLFPFYLSGHQSKILLVLYNCYLSLICMRHLVVIKILSSPLFSFNMQRNSVRQTSFKKMPVELCAGLETRVNKASKCPALWEYLEKEDIQTYK